MSWGIKVIGKRADVKAVIAADNCIPAKVKEAINLIIDAGGETKANDSVRVESHGHYSPEHDWSSIGKLEVETFKQAVAPTEPAEPTPVP